MHTKPHETLWDTMVDTFGYTKGNIYTNRLMYTWWRISDTNVTSELFAHGLHHNFPTDSHEAGWHRLVTFLHRIYNYDNLKEYSALIDKPWLPETLQ